MRLLIIATAMTIVASLNVEFTASQQEGFDPTAEQGMNPNPAEVPPDNTMIMTAEEGASQPNGYNDSEAPSNPPDLNFPTYNPENPVPSPPEETQQTENLPPPPEPPVDIPNPENPIPPPSEPTQPEQTLPEQTPPVNNPEDLPPPIETIETTTSQAAVPEQNPSSSVETIPETITQTAPETVVVPQTTTQTPDVNSTPNTPTNSNITTTIKPPKRKVWKGPVTVELTSYCLTCLCKQMSKCQLVPNCINGYCGKYHISYKYWKNAGNKTIGNDPPGSIRAFMHCAENDSCAQETIRSYMNKFGEDCNNDGVINCADYSQIHHLGANKCKNKINKTLQNSIQTCLIDEITKEFKMNTASARG